MGANTGVERARPLALRSSVWTNEYRCGRGQLAAGYAGPKEVSSGLVSALHVGTVEEGLGL